jgi:SAM-dependent methyltransferase
MPPTVNWADFDTSNETHWAAFIEYLATEVLSDRSSEVFLTRLRRKLLEDFAAGVAPDAQQLTLLSALAIFCANAEYVMAESPAETAMIAALDPAATVAGGLIFACYRETEAAELPLSAVRAAGQIADATSREVRAMYEENPYPRWSVLPEVAVDDTPVDMLVAGCGTGREALVEAKRYRRGHVTGIDLSRVSLAYALDRARAHDINNIELIQTDILDVAALGRTFDRIRCSGVLHHMKAPVAGLRALTQVLRPGGNIKFMVYSKAARRATLAARALAQELGVPPTFEGIRGFRETLVALPDDHPAHDVISSADFYSISGTRDLIFHVQEHNYTIPEVAALVADAGLEIVTFGHGGKPQARFKAMGFTDMSDLSAWEQTEAKYPSTFMNMYGLTVARPGEVRARG